MKCQILLSFITLIFLSIYCQAQDTSIDSLKSILLRQKEDTSMVNTLNALADNLYRSEPSEALGYGIQAKELAENLNYTKGLAYALKNIGLDYYMLGNYVEASINWEQSLTIFESLQDEAGASNLISNLGATYSFMGDNAKAIDYFLRALSMAEKKGDSMRIATCLLNIGSVYSFIPETVDKALPYYLRAFDISESIDYPEAIGISSFNIGDYYLQNKAYDSALLFFEKSLTVNQNTIDEAPTLNNIGKIYAEQGDFLTAIKYQKEALAKAEQMDGKLEMAQINLGLANTYYKQGKVNLAIEHFEKSKTISEEIESNNELKNAFEGLAGIYADQSDFRNAYRYQTLLNAIDKRIYNIETDDKIKNLQFGYQLDKKQDEIEILEQQSEIEQLTNKRQRVIIAAIGMTGLLLLLLAVLLYNRFKFAQRARKAIQKEKDRSENLLLNILPSQTAEELKEKGKAKARKYESVTILFTDFKEFTSIAAGLDPEVLVNEINECYIKFDQIVTKYGVEKIKTIGDAYMAAGGLPARNETHPFDVIKAAIEIRDYMLQLKTEREKANKLFFEIRIGIHSGPVVAGIVGIKKFAYDIWGDTVNCAARLEAASEPGKINISETTYQMIKEKYNCDYRGEIEAKNRGKLKMYFVGDRKSIASEIHA